MKDEAEMSAPSLCSPHDGAITPGEWEVVEIGESGQFVWYEVAADVQASGRQNTVVGLDGIERKEDARLIAAAPDLLSALMDMTNACTMTTPGQVAAFKAAWAAIDKAGVSP